MTELIKKLRLDILIWSGLILVFFATRLVNLGLIPIFTDEAIYLRWSQIMAFDASLRYLPLVDGKPPLFMWLTSVVIKTLPHIDILLTGRLVSVAAGFGGLLGIYFASYQLFHNKKISYLSALFYLLCPFTFFYDRFGLADSLLAMFGIWSLGLGIVLVRSIRLDVAMILGIVVGLGLLTKTPAELFLVLLPVLIIFFNFKSKNWQLNLLKLAGLYLVVFVFAQSIFSILRLFPLFNMINQKNLDFIVTPSYFLAHPLEFFPGNLKSLLSWQFVYLTPLVSLGVLVGVILGLGKYLKETLVLSFYFLFTLVAIAAFNKVIYPRYLLTFTPELLILAASGLFLAKPLVPKNSSRILVSILLALIFFWPSTTLGMLIFDPIHAPLLQSDRDQYLDGWPAGFGVKEVRNFLARQSKLNPKVFVGTEGTFGLMPYALELYQKDYPNAEIKPYWPLPAKIPPEAALASQKFPTYFLIYQRRTTPPDWQLQELMRFRQGLGRDYLRLYKVLPSS